MSLPLLTALFTTSQLLDSLVRQSAEAVYHSVDLVRTSRRLATLLSDEERTARLYHVLGDREHLLDLNEIHLSISEVAENILAMRVDDQLDTLIQEFSAQEAYIIAVLNHSSGGPEQLYQKKRHQEELLDSYKKLNSIARSIEQAGNEVMLAEVDGLKQSVSKGKETLLYQTYGLISFAVLLSIMFVVVLAKPVRQIDKAIDRLGEGDFETSIDVVGTKDLELLGRKLDWLRRRLAELDREKAKLIAHISHELKTPLASIKEGAGLLRDELVGPMTGGQKNVVAILDKNCSKLQALIQNILDFNMAQASKMPEEMKPLALHSVISKVLTDHQNPMIARNIDLRIQLEPVEIVGNQQQLTTVFDNLLSNAVKFTPDGGWVKVTLEKIGSRVLSRVIDSGPGVQEEERSKIFSPFYQGKRPKYATVKGSGLGLAISKEYVQNHGGTLRLCSVKKGGCFEVVFPAMEGKNA